MTQIHERSQHTVLTSHKVRKGQEDEQHQLKRLALTSTSEILVNKKYKKDQEESTSQRGKAQQVSMTLINTKYNVSYPSSMGGGQLSDAMRRGSFRNTTIMEMLSAEPWRFACSTRRFVTAFKSSAQRETVSPHTAENVIQATRFLTIFCFYTLVGFGLYRNAYF